MVTQVGNALEPSAPGANSSIHIKQQAIPLGNMMDYPPNLSQLTGKLSERNVLKERRRSSIHCRSKCVELLEQAYGLEFSTGVSSAGQNG